MNTNILGIPMLIGALITFNICNLIINKLMQLNVPILNCIAFSSDNAVVMLGKKTGVVTLLKEHYKN